jgi:hypothetical protein
VALLHQVDGHREPLLRRAGRLAEVVRARAVLAREVVAFAACAACHTIDADERSDGLGPNLFGVVARTVVSNASFRDDSPGLRPVGGKWTEAPLDAFLRRRRYGRLADRTGRHAGWYAAACLAPPRMDPSLWRPTARDAKGPVSAAPRSEAPAGDSRLDRLGQGLEVVFFGLAIALVAIYILQFGTSYVLRFGTTLDPVAAVYVAAFAVFSYVLVSRLARRSDVQLALLLTLAWIPLYWLRPVQFLGDNWFRRMRRSDGMMLSEALAEAILRVFYETGNWSLTPFLSPLCAVPVTFLAILTLLELVADGVHARPWRLFAVLLFASSGLHLLFFRGFVESTQIAAPFAIASVLLLARFTRSGDRRSANAAGLSAGLACLGHGSHTFWLPVLVLVPAFAAAGARQPRGKRIFGPLAIALGVMGAALLALELVDWLPVRMGNVTGGRDARSFVPLFEITSKWERYLFFSLPHFVEAANIFATSGLALLVLIPAFAGLRARVTWSFRQAEQRTYLLFVLLFLAHAALFLSWNFDYGFPRDYDLMTSLGLTWLGLPLVVAMRLWPRPPPYAWAALALAGFASWSVISGLLAPPS